MLNKNDDDVHSFFQQLQRCRTGISDTEDPDNPYFPRCEMIKPVQKKAPIRSKIAKKGLRRGDTYDVNNDRQLEIQLATERSFPDRRLTTSAMENFLKIFLEKPHHVASEPTKLCFKYSSCEPHVSTEALCSRRVIDRILEHDKKWVNLWIFWVFFESISILPYIGQLQY